jgi:hypothetical protein
MPGITVEKHVGMEQASLLIDTDSGAFNMDLSSKCGGIFENF